MPTGYTAAIADGITFKQYALNCARAFGALVTMRDEPSDAPIPEKFEATDYHLKAIADANQRAEELRAMSGDALTQAYQAALDAERDERRQSSQKRAELRAKYEAMLEQALAFKAPTDDHAEYARFMADQIRESIDFDCKEYPPFRPVPETADKWLAQEISEAVRSIGYHRKEHQQELDRVAKRNAWVSALRDSLKDYV